MGNPLFDFCGKIDIKEKENICGTDIEMRVLNMGEEMACLRDTAYLDSLTRTYAVKLHKLARALVSVNGYVVEYQPKEENEQITEAKKILQNIELLEKYDPILIDVLYGVFDRLCVKRDAIVKNYAETGKIDTSKEFIEGLENKKAIAV